MARTGDRRWQSPGLAFLLLCASLVISVLFGEVILRLLGHHGAPEASIGNTYVVDDPILDWRHVPNSELKVGKVVYRYNRSGFRDVDHAFEKTQGVKRIVVVGDSLTEGHGVEWPSVFSRIVQWELGSGVEAITIAAGGLNTPQEVHLLEQEGLRYKPELVILNFGLNDCDFYSSFRGAERYNAEKDSRIGIFNLPINPRVKRLLKSSAFIYFVKERVEELTGRLLGEQEADYFSNLWGKEECRERIKAGFDRLASLAKEKQFDVVVIMWPLIMDYRQYRFKDIHEWVKEEAEKRGFSTIDLLSAFSRVSYRKLQVTAEDNVHPNALGHKMGAAAFVAWYRSR